MLDRRIVFGGDVIDAYIAGAPSIIVPERKMTVTPIPGTSREDVKMEDAWEPYDQPYSIFVGDGSQDSIQGQIKDIASKLYKTGFQRLEDDYDPEYFRLAYFKGPFDIENRFTRAGKADIEFHCRPERFLKSGDAAVRVESGAVLTNPTAFNAAPLIKIEGSGSGTVTIAGVTMTFTGLIDYLYIDCDKMDVYRLATENRNSLMTGSFPLLPPGNSTVEFGGGITGVEITPRWWTI